jgi:hypothetical protein
MVVDRYTLQKIREGGPVSVVRLVYGMSGMMITLRECLPRNLP